MVEAQDGPIDERFVVIINADSEPVLSRLRARRIRYVVKKLNSRAENWVKTCQLLEAPGAGAVVVRLNRHNLEQLTASGTDFAGQLYRDHADVAPRLLRAISARPHLVLLHEHIALGQDFVTSAPSGWAAEGLEYEETLVPETRAAAFGLLEASGVRPTFYTRNAEADQLAAVFLDDFESNLVLRIYIPSDRLLAEETARLLDMFRDWLVATQQLSVRRAGYRTSRGEVVEFFSDGRLTSDELSNHARGFQRFVDLLSADPDASAVALQKVGVDKELARKFVEKNARALRRIQVEVRHAYELEVFTLRQSAEADLVDEIDVRVPLDDIGILVRKLFGEASSDPVEPRRDRPTDTQHTIHASESLHQLSGPSDTGSDLLRTVESVEPDPGLQTMVHDLADPETPNDRRGAAAAGLRSFLVRSRDRLEVEAFRVFTNWVNSQMGL